LKLLIKPIEQIIIENPQKKFLCWGVGKNFILLTENFSKYDFQEKIYCLVDKDINKIGKTIEINNQKFEVKSIGEIFHIAVSEVILLITCAKYWDIINEISNHPLMRNVDVMVYTLFNEREYFYIFVSQNQWMNRFFQLNSSKDVKYFKSLLQHIKLICNMQFTKLNCHIYELEKKSFIEYQVCLNKSSSKQELSGEWYINPFELFTADEWKNKCDQKIGRDEYIIFNIPIDEDKNVKWLSRHSLESLHVYINDEEESALIVVDNAVNTKYKNCTIMVVTHKVLKGQLTALYLPIYVGEKDEFIQDYQRDDVGNNISELNEKINECTALYWLWKNYSCEYVGLNHYRRYFSNLIDNKKIIDQYTIDRLLKYFDIIVVQHVFTGNLTIYEQLKKSLDESVYYEALHIIENSILKNQSDYLESFHKIFNGHVMHPFNMFIMQKDICDRYCEWLFSIIIEAAEKMDVKRLNTYNKRVIGFFAERLFSVWLSRQEFSVRELPFIFCDT